MLQEPVLIHASSATQSYRLGWTHQATCYECEWCLRVVQEIPTKVLVVERGVDDSQPVLVTKWFCSAQQYCDCPLRV